MAIMRYYVLAFCRFIDRGMCKFIIEVYRICGQLGRYLKKVSKTNFEYLLICEAKYRAV